MKQSSLKVGDYIELLHMPNDPNPIKEGDKGLVKRITPWGNGEFQIEVEWESGRRLFLIEPVDKFKIVKREE